MRERAVDMVLNRCRVLEQNARKAEKGTHVRRGTDWKLKFHQARKWENKQKGKGWWVREARRASTQPGQSSLFAAQFHLEGAPAGPIFRLKEFHFINLRLPKRELIMSL